MKVTYVDKLKYTYLAFSNSYPYKYTIFQQYIGSNILVEDCHGGTFNLGRLSSRLEETLLLQHLILVAAGTGFTPMAKVLQYFVAAAQQSAEKNNRKSASSFATFLNFNKRSNDIIWKELRYSSDCC